MSHQHDEEPQVFMRLKDNPSVAGAVIGQGDSYITIGNWVLDDVTRIPAAFELCPEPDAPAEMLSQSQRDALDWVLRYYIDIAFERDLEPKDGLSEALDLFKLAELCGVAEVVKQAKDLLNREQARFDALPKPPRIGLTLGVNGNDEGHEFATLDEAAAKAAEWIKGIDPAHGRADYRVSVELLGED